MSINEATFSINVTAVSGENYAGTFKVRKRLSHGQTLRRDELRRELLGARGDSAPETMQKNAIILSVCAAHIIDAPRWWTQNSNGLDLLDSEPVMEVFDEISKIVQAVEDELTAKAAKAKEQLEK